MKLLNLTVRNYLLYSLAIILLALPVFYFTMEKLMLEDVDEALWLRKEALLLQVPRIKNEHEVKLWQKLDGSIRVQALTIPLRRDSIYFTAHYDSLEQELEPFRELATVMSINGRPRVVLIGTNLVESEDLAQSVVKLQASLLVALLLGLLYLNRRTALRVWQPFYQILANLKEFNVTKHHTITLPDTDIQEFKDLKMAIAGLIQKNREAYISQKHFTENAAHEMQTPLAILHGKLEMLLQTPSLSEQQATLITEALEGNSRLSKLTKNLLLLAKIENKQYHTTEDLDLPAILHQLVRHYKESIHLKGIKVTQQLQPLTLKTNRVMLEVLLTNILSNAIRHNLQQGSIHIQVQENKLQVVNTGQPLNLNPEILFQRFQKDSANPKSNGLGLAIAKKICDLYGYQIQYIHQSGQHRVEISFIEDRE
jgi:two-component system sensor histidine kinase QseC